MKFERRTFKVEVRKSESDDGRKFRGTAVVFNQLSEDLGGFREEIAPEAFDGCDMADVRCLFNHDESKVLGRTVSNTLTITRDANGVHFECDSPDTSYARDLAVSMGRGDVDQCSFSFTVPAGGAKWTEDRDTGSATRRVNQISRLFDVSVVTYPAYTQTSADIRSCADILSERTAGQTAATEQAVTPATGDALELRRKLELEFYGRQ